MKKITPHQKSTESLIKLHMKKHYTVQYLFDECKKHFDIYSWIDLSKITSDRQGDYVIYFKDVQEADEENKNMSANELKKRGKQEITLEERLLVELEYFKKTGKHLDIINWTLCAGSRRADGYVPCVGFVPGCGRVRVSFFCCSPGSSDDDLRSRSAVSLPTEASGAKP